MHRNAILRFAVAAVVLTMMGTAFAAPVAADAEAGGSYNCDQGSAGSSGDVSASDQEGTEVQPGGPDQAILHLLGADGSGTADCDDDSAGEQQDSHGKLYADGGSAGGAEAGFNDDEQVIVDAGTDEDPEEGHPDDPNTVAVPP